MGTTTMGTNNSNMSNITNMTGSGGSGISGGDKNGNMMMNGKSTLSNSTTGSKR